MSLAFEMRLTEKYSGLNGTLRQAQNYLADNPLDTMPRTRRTALREEMRAQIGRRVNDFANRAERLKQDHNENKERFLNADFAALQANLQIFVDTVDHEARDAAIGRTADARKVLLLGALASLIGAGLNGQDALIIVTTPPFSDRAIHAAQRAQQQGVYVVLMTDTHSSPALKHAPARFIVATDSPHFNSSYVVTMFLVGSRLGVLLSRSGPAAPARIDEVEGANRVPADVRDL